MKKTIFILLFALATTTDALAQVNLLKHPRVREYVANHFSFRDVNPLHQAEADSIAVLFRDILAAWEDDPKPVWGSGDGGLRARALELFYDNSRIGDEDSPDIYRMTMRRYHCFIALALLPGRDYAWYTTFIDDARGWVGRNLRNDDHAPVLELATIDMVDALLETNYGHLLGEQEITILRKNVAMLSERKQELYITDLLVEEYASIVDLIVDASKKRQNNVTQP